MTDVAGKTAFVTGGASGLGLATARALADRGARLILADIDGAGAEAAAEARSAGLYMQGWPRTHHTILTRAAPQAVRRLHPIYFRSKVIRGTHRSHLLRGRFMASPSAAESSPSAHVDTFARDHLPPPDLWPLFRGLAFASDKAERPLLLIRGALSDLLAPATADRMRQIAPHMAFAEVANVGHAPMLDEPEALSAIDAWLKEAP